MITRFQSTVTVIGHDAIYPGIDIRRKFQILKSIEQYQTDLLARAKALRKRALPVDCDHDYYDELVAIAERHLSYTRQQLSITLDSIQ